jgi:tetratricopeptide (TPR) repeat protein
MLSYSSGDRKSMRADTNQEELAGRLDRLMSMLQTDPANGPLRRQCVDLASSLGKFDVVIDLAEAALALDAANPMASFDKATGLIGNRDYRGALQILEDLDGRVGQDMAIAMNRALCHYCLAEYEQARPLLETCYGSGMRHAGLVRLLVSTLHHLGAMDGAARVADENTAVALADGPLAGVFALMYLDNDDAAKASRWAKVALQLNPRSIDGRVVEGTLLTSRMQLDKAKQMLESVLADAPQTGRAWIGIGALSLLARDLATAKEQISRGLELMPGHVGSWHLLGWTQLMAGDLNAAEKTFDTALAADRNFSESHGALAVIAAMRGEKERAQQFMKVALKLDAGCLSAKFAEAVLAGNADPARAQSIIRDTVGGLSSKDGSALSQLLGKMTRH